MAGEAPGTWQRRPGRLLLLPPSSSSFLLSSSGGVGAGGGYGGVGVGGAVAGVRVCMFAVCVGRLGQEVKSPLCRVPPIWHSAKFFFNFFNSLPSAT